MDGRVRESELTRRAHGRYFPRPRQHRRRDIDTHDMPAWSHGARESEGGGPAAAADIEHALASPDAGAIDQQIGNRLKQDVLHRLAVGPTLAAGAVPVRNLVGVLIVA